MAEVAETQLPGVGVRYDFVTTDGDRIGVLVHRTGRRELLLYDDDDPDACGSVVRLDADDTHTLAELLGATQVSERLAELQQDIEGLTIDWLPVAATSACSGATLREAALRSSTGVSIVAVVRGTETIPAPGGDFQLLPGDTAVAVGTPEGIKELFGLLQSGARTGP
ncbi:MAG: potassium transporter TrkA [Actinomycetota bacterium]|nr:potassium transporter TrkA [Actinomycetota bacterium]